MRHHPFAPMAADFPSFLCRGAREEGLKVGKHINKSGRDKDTIREEETVDNDDKKKGEEEAGDEGDNGTDERPRVDGPNHPFFTPEELGDHRYLFQKIMGMTMDAR